MLFALVHETCSVAHVSISWQDIAEFTQELSPTVWAVFWLDLLLQFSPSLLFTEIKKRLSWCISSVFSLAFLDVVQTSNDDPSSVKVYKSESKDVKQANQFKNQHNFTQG